MTTPTEHERREARAVEIVLAILAGVTVFTLALLAAWGASHWDASVTHSWPLIPMAGVGGIVTTFATLVSLRRAGL